MFTPKPKTVTENWVIEAPFVGTRYLGHISLGIKLFCFTR